MNLGRGEAERKRLPQRRSIRLKGYDYTTPGAYFVTICADARRCTFGTVKGDAVILNRLGEFVHSAWSEMPLYWRGIGLDLCVTMPNHFHGIVVITGELPRVNRCIGGSGHAALEGKKPSLFDVIRRYKSYTTAVWRRRFRSAHGQMAQRRRR